MSERRRLFHLGLWGPRVDEGVEWEIEHHMNERIDELVAEGKSRAEAEVEARRTFGDVRRVRMEMRKIDRQRERTMRLQDVLETVWQDVRYGLRGLVRDSTFTMSLILTMGLGIGANVAMFTVLDALLLRPLPYHQPNELHQLFAMDPNDRYGQPYFPWEFARSVDEQKIFDRLLVHSRPSVLYTGGVEAMRLSAEAVTAEFEETLGVNPILGRGFLPEDMQVGREHVVILDHAFWSRALGAANDIIGKSITLDGEQYDVIGVMPAGFKFPEYSTTDVWLPIREDGKVLGQPLRNIYMLGRVADDKLEATSARFATEGARLFRELAPKQPKTVRLESLDASRARGENLHRSLWLLAGAVQLILLIAAVNVVNLLLVRGIGRAREIAVRLAIGASRARLVRQLTTETFTITALSALAAVALALVSLRAIQGIMPSDVTFFAPHAIGVERRAILFTLMLTMLCGLILGVVPALLATRRSRRDASNDLTRYASRTPSRARLRRSLVIVEVALSVTLLVGAGLLMRSFLRLNAVDSGFRPDNLAVLQIELSSASHPTAANRTEYVRRVAETIEALPGVEGATVSNGLPPNTNISFGLKLQAEGEQAKAEGNPMLLPWAVIQPDFFEVTGARLLAGRTFAENEPDDAAIIDQDLARFLWGSQNALNRRFRISEEDPWLTVVGVMADLKLMGPDHRRGNFEMLRPMGAQGPAGYVTIAVRARNGVNSLHPEIRRAVHSIDANQPIGELTAASDFYAESIEMPRFLFVLISVLAGLALVLAAIGIYGVLAFGVSQRAHEFGVRAALGARAVDVTSLVVREGVLLAAVGVVIGVSCALLLSRFIQALLFGIEPVDPITLLPPKK